MLHKFNVVIGAVAFLSAGLASAQEVVVKIGHVGPTSGAKMDEMMSISFDAGYGSIFGDGNRVEVDLCEACLRDTLGAWLRVRTVADTSLATKLAAFKPEVHGGEFPSSQSAGPV